MLTDHQKHVCVCLDCQCLREIKELQTQLKLHTRSALIRYLVHEAFIEVCKVPKFRSGYVNSR